jgi:hypothetical protein
MSFGGSSGLFSLEVGKHVGFALALGNQLRTHLALGVDCIERAVRSAPLRHLLDCSVDLGELSVDIGERVGLRIDPDRDGGSLGLDCPIRSPKWATTSWA